MTYGHRHNTTTRMLVCTNIAIDIKKKKILLIKPLKWKCIAETSHCWTNEQTNIVTSLSYVSHTHSLNFCSKELFPFAKDSLLNIGFLCS